jgi:hypothetical protein
MQYMIGNTGGIIVDNVQLTYLQTVELDTTEAKSYLLQGVVLLSPKRSTDDEEPQEPQLQGEP